MDGLADVCSFLPSNDIEGDCGTTVAILTDTAEKATAVAASEGVYGVVPITTGKHIYNNWTPIMNKKGAFNPLMDPFLMEANKDIIPDYRANDCPKTLDLLAKVVYIWVDPDWTKSDMDAKITAIRKAIKGA